MEELSLYMKLEQLSFAQIHILVKLSANELIEGSNL